MDARQHKAPRDHAIVVGIKRYRDVFPRLNGSVNDALLFREWLVDEARGGLDPAHVTLICSTDEGDLKPIRDQIEDEIGRFFTMRLNTTGPVGRRLYLYFSGHGVTPPANKDDCGLLMANANSPGPLRALPGRLALDRLRWAGLFDEVVLIMDCCREVNGDVDAHLGLPDRTDPTIPDGATYMYGFAAKWNAAAVERLLPHPLDPAKPPLWQGVFTHVLLKGLDKAVSSERQVTAHTLKPFVQSSILELLKDAADNRWPEIFFDERRPIVFGRGTFTEVTVTLSNPAASLEVLAGEQFTPLTLEVTHVTTNVRRVWLPYGLYLLKSAVGAGPAMSQVVRALGERIDVQL